MDTSQGQDFDLDEDLFNFDEPEVEEINEEEEEDLEAIFAAFQSEEKAREEADEKFLAGGPDPSGDHSSESDFGISTNDMPSFDEGGSDPGGLQSASSNNDSGHDASLGQGAHASAAGGSASKLMQVAGPVSKSTLLILVSVTMLNGLVAFVSLRNATTMRDTVMNAERRMAETADQIRGETLDQARQIVELRKPLVPPNIEDHPTFTRAADLIREGNFIEARARIYALLAIVDRLEETAREEIEARAQFLLAEASHLEALTRYREEEL